MALVNTKQMLLNAQSGGYAVGAFNIENMEMAQAVIWTAERLRSPVICAISQNAMRYANAELYAANIKCLAETAVIPVAIHVDHAENEEIVIKALHGGFTSIMIDGSKLTYAQNLAMTKRIVQLCDILHIPVEGELGAIGGKIDAVPDYRLIYTDPLAAKDFAEQTGVSSLAVAIGTAHGVYKNIPRLDYQRLSATREHVSVPLVLHGASGLSTSQVHECIKRGICKVNYATELRIGFTNAVRAYLAQDAVCNDPKVYGKAAREAVCDIVEEKLRAVGSVGKS